jgi:hypothetical protein
VGHGDLYREAGVRSGKRRNRPTSFDKRVNEHLAESSRPLAVVRSIVTDQCGGFRLSMSGQLSLEVFPDGSRGADELEWWRLFRPGTRGSHFVVSTVGISI